MGINGGHTKLRVAESILDTLDKEEGDIDSPARACCEVLATFLLFSGPLLPHLENGIRWGNSLVMKMAFFELFAVLGAYPALGSKSLPFDFLQEFVSP